MLSEGNMATLTESQVILKRIIARVLIIVALYPILLGGVANMPQRYRANWMRMRQEHREALERDRLRRLEREMTGRSQDATAYLRSQ